MDSPPVTSFFPDFMLETPSVFHLLYALGAVEA
jgi:hypothetical protein